MNPVDYINDKTNLSVHTQQALGFSMPPIIPLRTTVVVKEAQSQQASEELQSALRTGLVENTNWIVPLTLKAPGEIDFKLPLDPIVSLSSKNIITRRYVSKSAIRGTIKERWGQDDWSITISGIFIEANKTQRDDQLTHLRRFFDVKDSIEVVCPLLNELNITRIAIEDYDFPFTKGEENQAFVIKAYSDESYTLLLG